MLCAWLALSHFCANNTVAWVGDSLRQRLSEPMLVPGWTGYYGWNYESAVALEALRNPPWYAAVAVDALLSSRALTVGQPGWWLARHFPVTFLWTVGDRVGLFGSLFRDTAGAQAVYCSAVRGVRQWRRHADWPGLVTRQFGHGRKCRRWLWLDDVYMAGAALLADYPDETRAMLVQARQAFVDPVDGLWWHGLCATTGVATGAKWGRANAWALLALSRYVVRTEDSEASEWLHHDLQMLSGYQRASGAFGNIVNDAASPDETSLTSVFVYAVAVERRARPDQTNGDLRPRALAALSWLNTRRARGLRLSDSCPPHGQSPDYNRGVSATKLTAGPAVALMAWARVGEVLLHNASATHYRAASRAQTTADPCDGRPRTSAIFYAWLALGGAAVGVGCGCCLSRGRRVTGTGLRLRGLGPRADSL